MSCTMAVEPDDTILSVVYAYLDMLRSVLYISEHNDLSSNLCMTGIHVVLAW